MSGGPRRLQVIKAFTGFRPVNFPQRLARGDQRKVEAHGFRNQIRNLRRQVVEGGADDAAKPARCKPSLASRFVNRNYAPDFEGVGCLLLGRIRGTVFTRVS